MLFANTSGKLLIIYGFSSQSKLVRNKTHKPCCKSIFRFHVAASSCETQQNCVVSTYGQHSWRNRSQLAADQSHKRRHSQMCIDVKNGDKVQLLFPSVVFVVRVNKLQFIQFPRMKNAIIKISRTSAADSPFFIRAWQIYIIWHFIRKQTKQNIKIE